MLALKQDRQKRNVLRTVSHTLEMLITSGFLYLRMEKEHKLAIRFEVRPRGRRRRIRGPQIFLAVFDRLR